jgi:hypothetical protein
MSSILIRVSKKYNITPENAIPLVQHTIKEKKNVNSSLSNLYSLNPIEYSAQPDQLYQCSLFSVEVEEITVQDKEASILLAQTNRLKHCLKQSSYRIALTNNKYNLISISHSQNHCSLYKNNTSITFSQPMYLIIDFSDFHSRRQYIAADIEKICKGIEQLLESNDKMHVTNIKSLMEDKYSFMNTYSIVEKMQEEYTAYIDKYKNLVESLKEKEIESKQKLRHMESMHPEQLHQTIKTNHEKQKLEKELSDLCKNRQKSESLLIKIRNEKLALCLKVDNLLYASAVLFTEIVQQIEYFSDLIKENK